MNSCWEVCHCLWMIDKHVKITHLYGFNFAIILALQGVYKFAVRIGDENVLGTRAYLRGGGLGAAQINETSWAMFHFVNIFFKSAMNGNLNYIKLHLTI